jgi:zinc transport system substrate-binding protein
VVASLSDADLIIANGAGFEAWMGTVALPEGKVVETAKKLDLIILEADTHSHGAEGEHSHTAEDPHTWGDPTGFFIQARSVHAALVKTQPSQREVFDANLDVLERDLKMLSGRLSGATAHLQGRPLAASHPAFNYLARRFQLKVTSFDFDPANPPSAEQLERFTAWADGKTPPVLLWESEPTGPVTQAFPDNVLHQYIDPLESPGSSGEYDYLAQVGVNARRFEGLLAPAAEQ